jgi:hypothetical protein
MTGFAPIFRSFSPIKLTQLSLSVSLIFAKSAGEEVITVSGDPRCGEKRA